MAGPSPGTPGAATARCPQPGFEIFLDGMRVTTVVGRFDEDRISELYVVRSPDKLAWMDEVVALAR